MELNRIHGVAAAQAQLFGFSLLSLWDKEQADSTAVPADCTCSAYLETHAQRLSLPGKALYTLRYHAYNFQQLLVLLHISNYGGKITCFQVLLYPVVSMSHPDSHKRSRRALLGEYGKHSRAMRDSLSLEKHVAKDCPPVFLVNCKDDPIVKYHNSELLDSALSAQGIRHRYIQYRTGGHGFGASETKGTAECRAWKKAFLSWLQETNESTSDKRHVSSQVTWHVR